MPKDTSCFATYEMGTVKQINIKNQKLIIFTMILLILKILNQTCQKQIKNHRRTLAFTILDITIKKIGDCKNIYSVNPLYLGITHANKYIEEINENKYLIFDSMELHSIDENKELLKKYNDVFNGIRDKINGINSDECDYEKDYMKITFNSDDNLPLNKPLKFHNKTITIRSVFKEDGKLYLQVFLDDALCELST